MKGRYCTIACVTLLGLHAGPARPAVPGSLHYVWSNVVVGGGGFSPNILFSPVEPGLAYLRTDIGGVYRYDQSQQHWIALQDDMAEGNYFGVESVAPDPRQFGGRVRCSRKCIAPGQRPFCDPTTEARPGTSSPSHFVWVATRMDTASASAWRSIHTTRIFSTSVRDTMACDEVPMAGAPGRASRPVPAPGLGLPAPHRTHAGISFVLFDPRTGSHDARQQPRCSWRSLIPANVDLFRSDDAGASWQPVPGRPRADLLPVRAQRASNGILYLTYSDGVGPTASQTGQCSRSTPRLHPGATSLHPGRPVGSWVWPLTPGSPIFSSPQPQIAGWARHYLAEHGSRATLGKPAAAQ